MYANRTPQTQKSGVSPSQAFVSSTSRRKPLQDNSWIKAKDDEEEQGVDDFNYGKDVLGKTMTNTVSKPATTKQSNTPVSSSTKRVSVAPDIPKKPLTSTATKPLVPEKKTTPTLQTNNFTARVFSGANSNEKVVSPVKKSMDEKLPLSEPRKDAVDSSQKKTEIPVPPPIPPVRTEKKPEIPVPPPITPTPVSVRTEKKPEIPVPPPITPTPVSVRTEKKPEIPVPPPITPTPVSVRTEKKPEIPVPPPITPTPVSVRKTSEVITSPEKSYTSFTSKTDPYSRTLELSPTKSNWDYQQLNTINTEKVILPVSQTLHSPIKTIPSSAPSRIVGKRDLCSFCAKSINENERIILDELQIFSHTFCFKCDTCNHTLGNLGAGATLWVHRGHVTCDRCYSKTKDHWYR